MIFPRRKDVSEMVFISCDLLGLGHAQAGDKIMSLETEIRDTLSQASHGRTEFEAFNQRYGEWQARTRKLKPNLLVILRLWGGL